MSRSSPNPRPRAVLFPPAFFRRSCAAALALLAHGAPAQGTQPPPVTTTQNTSLVAPGLIFITPSPPRIPKTGEVASTGPMIVDGQGRPVWFNPLPAGEISSDLRVQTYLGNPVLTWTQGAGFQVTQAGQNTDYISDTSYNVIATVQAGNGLNADEHEFQLTAEGTALLTIYHNVSYDLSALGGPASGTVQEGVVQEIDVASGNVLLEWHSLDHVGLDESYAAVPTSGIYDYFHINSVTVDTDGNLLISSRHTWTIYKVNRTTGAIIWRLGGKKSDYALGPGLPFAWQHNAVAVDSSTIRIFDNESNGTPVLPASRVIWVKHDDSAMTAAIIRSVQHPDGLSVPAEGSGQDLANGDTFVGWGILGRFSEFDPNGALLFDASLPSGYNDYRAFKFPWTGMPTTVPTAVVLPNGDGTTTVHAVWNGASQVATWNILAGASPGSLSQVESAPWNGLDTQVVVPGNLVFVQVVAVSAVGATLGTSAATTASLGFTTQPAGQTIADGSTVIFSAAASGNSTTYQWYLNSVPISDGASGTATYTGTASPTLVVGSASAGNAGSYTCVATGPSGTATSNPAVLVVSETQDVGRLTNVSARAAVETGDNALTAGFVVGGSQASGTEPLLVRASGPSLASFGITGVLPDPQLVITPVGAMDPVPKVVSAWNGNPLIASTAADVGAFAWTDSLSLDSATVHAFHMGPHTAEVVGASGDTGVALAEVFDATPDGTYTPAIPHLLNVSARALVGTGNNILIAGFVIGGSTSKTVLIRASGPALAAYGLAGTLADPDLQLYSSATGNLLSDARAWGGDPNIASAAAAAGAFAWQDPSSHDAALLVTLPPGAYTAQVAGQNGETGVALVEVYEVQ